MLTFISKSTLFTCFFSLVVFATQAQEKNRKENQSPIPTLRSSEDILELFIKGNENTIYFNVKDGVKVKRTHIDSLLPKFKEYIDNFIYRYKERNQSDEYGFTSAQHKSIYEKIRIQKLLCFKKRSKGELSQILFFINRLQFSKERIALLLEYANLTIGEESNIDDVQKFCEKAKLDVIAIKDIYEKGIAFLYIGDFAAYYRVNPIAIKMYYLAIEAFSDCEKDAITKNNEQGRVYARLANLFYYIGVRAAYEKECAYLEKAAEYFMESKNAHDANINALLSYVVRAYLWTNYWQYYQSESLGNENNRNLNHLNKWYAYYKKNPDNIELETNFFGLYCIAQYINEQKSEIALKYYLEAFPYAALADNISQLKVVLVSIANKYSSLGKYDLALRYANLELYLTENLNDEFELNDAILDKASVFLGIKQYDSALVYSNKIIFDQSLGDCFFLNQYEELLEKAVKIKYQVLDSLRQNNDSARYYERIYTTAQTDRVSVLSVLYSIESQAIGEWLERSNEKVIDNETELKRIAENNSRLQEKLKIEAQETAKEALKQKDFSDSLLILKESLRLADSIRAVYVLQNEKERAKQKDTDRKREKWYYVIGGIGLIMGLVIVFFLLHQKNISKSNKLLGEYNRVNGLAKNKIHNIENDYSEISNLLDDNQIEKLKHYSTKYEAFLAVFLQNWKREHISLKDELESTLRYLNVKKVLNDRLNVKIQNTVTEAGSVKFIQSVFDTLLDNSVRHGFKNKEGDLNFDIFIKREGAFLECTIKDNGISPETKEEYLADAESGLNILKRRILNFYSEHRIKADKHFFEIAPLSKESGTIIKIKLPYVET